MRQNSENFRVLVAMRAVNRMANGGINSLYELVRGFSDADVVVFSNLDERDARSWSELGCNFHSCGIFAPSNSRIINALKSPLNALISIVSAIHCLSRYKPNVILCNDIRVATLFLPLAFATKTPIVFFIRDVFPPRREYTLRWRVICGASSLCLCLSHDMRDQLKRRIRPILGRKMRLEVVPSVVDFDRYFSPTPVQGIALRKELNIDEDQFAIACVAAVCPKKRQLDLLRILPELRNRVPNAHLHIIGDFDPNNDTYARACLSLVGQLGVNESVTFHGYDAEPARWYQAADCVVLASEREGLARCMIESLSCGTPVISFAVTSAREVLEDGKCGLVVDCNDYAGLINAFATFAFNENLMIMYRKNALLVSHQRFRRETNAALLLRLLREVSR